MASLFDRRDVLTGAGGLAAAGLWRSGSAAAEPPPETTRLRLARYPVICLAPQYIVDALLRAEGFTDVEFVAASSARAAGEGEVDFDIHAAPWIAFHVDKGLPITAVGGVHVGCYELFARDDIRTISDLQGKRVIEPIVEDSATFLFMTMLAHVGLDPMNDIEWLSADPGENMLEAFVAGKSDAFLGFPPEPQELRDRGVGRVILNTSLDRPWSHYFCCMAIGNRDFVAAHPVATKRYLRALLKAIDLCAADPEYAAGLLVEGGFAGRYDYALQTLNEVPYDRWRDYDPEDAIRFYALRLHELGMLEDHPNRVIEEGTDWRIFNELKRELRV